MSVKRETAEERKALPLATGVLDYFGDALLVVAAVSRAGNEQHHPGEPLWWDKSKSSDEADALMRHLLDRGKLDTDGLRHSGKVAWRALAMLQRELDAETEEQSRADALKAAILGAAKNSPLILKHDEPMVIIGPQITPTCMCPAWYYNWLKHTSTCPLYVP